MAISTTQHNSYNHDTANLRSRKRGTFAWRPPTGIAISHIFFIRSCQASESQLLASLFNSKLAAVSWPVETGMEFPVVGAPQRCLFRNSRIWAIHLPPDFKAYPRLASVSLGHKPPATHTFPPLNIYLGGDKATWKVCRLFSPTVSPRMPRCGANTGTL